MSAVVVALLLFSVSQGQRLPRDQWGLKKL
jgi:hypothetical protein